MSGRPVLDKAMSEADFTRQVVELLQYRGWLVYHALPAVTGRGRHLTPTQGDTGFPDIVAVRDGTIVVLELKRHGRFPTEGQERWLGHFCNAQLDRFHRTVTVRPVLHCGWATPLDWDWLERVSRP